MVDTPEETAPVEAPVEEPADAPSPESPPEPEAVPDPSPTPEEPSEPDAAPQETPPDLGAPFIPPTATSVMGGQALAADPDSIRNPKAFTPKAVAEVIAVTSIPAYDKRSVAVALGEAFELGEDFVLYAQTLPAQYERQVQ